MIVRPHIVIPLAIPFIIKNRRTWWWFAGSTMILAIISLIYVGWDGIRGFLDMLAVSGSGINTTTGEESMVNIISILLQTFPGIPVSISRWIGWGTYFISFIFLCIYWKKSDHIGGKQISLAILITALTTPHNHMHDLILRTLPLITFYSLSKNHKDIKFWAASLPWWMSMALLCSFFVPFLEANIPYVVLVFLFILTIKPEWIHSNRRENYGELT